MYVSQERGPAGHAGVLSLVTDIPLGILLFMADPLSWPTGPQEDRLKGRLRLTIMLEISLSPRCV
jgi:hypothetical protein